MRAPRLGLPGRRSIPDLLTWATLAALVLWAAAPIVYLLLRAAAHHETLSGADSLFAADQLQYLAWIRSEGEHVLANNGFALTGGGHVFLHPMFVLSGLLWRAGFGIALSYLVWLPVAVAVLFIGYRQYTRRMIPGALAPVAGLALALFFVTPFDPLAGWTVGSNGLGTLSGELAPSGSLYGYFPIAITTGLMPLFILRLERLVDGLGRDDQPSPTAAGLVLTSGLGLLVAWLHPWQGATLLLLMGAVLTLARLRRTHWPLLIPAIATASPLAYYFVLSKVDAAWKVAHVQSPPGRPNVLLLLLALSPLLVFAAVGRREWRRSTGELLLVLWPVCALVVYFLSPEYGPHALEGLSLPLVVLAVTGWQRLRPPAWLAVALIAVSTVPGLVFDLRLFHEVVLADPQGLLFRDDETRALAYIEHARVAGGVIPSLRISAAVPAYTGRRTWIGHALWTPGYATRANQVGQLFAGVLSPAASRAFLRQVGARFLLDDCEPGFAPSWLNPLLLGERHFGCVTVYELNVRALPAPL